MDEIDLDQIEQHAAVFPRKQHGGINLDEPCKCGHLKRWHIFNRETKWPCTEPDCPCPDFTYGYLWKADGTFNPRGRSKLHSR